MLQGSTPLVKTVAYAAIQNTVTRLVGCVSSAGMVSSSSSASAVVGGQQQRCGVMPGPQVMVTVSTLSHPSNGTCVLQSTMFQPWLSPRQQDSQHACPQQARQDAGRACTASTRGLIQHLAIASVTPGEPTDEISVNAAAAAAAAAAAHVQQKPPPQGKSAAAAQAWQQVLQALTHPDPSQTDSTSGNIPTVAQHSSTVEQQHPQQQLSEAVEAAISGRPVPTAQQLLPLLSAAGAYHQQTPTPNLVAVLTSAAAAALPQLQPHQLPSVLLALHTLQNGRAAALGPDLVGGLQHRRAADGALAGAHHQNTTSQATAVQHGYESSALANPSLPHAGDANKADQQHAAAVTKALRSYLQQQQGALDPSSTAAIAAACAATQQRDTFPILAMLVLDHVSHMTPGQVVTVASAFAAMQHYNQSVCAAIAQQAGAILQQQGYKLQHETAPAGPAVAAESRLQWNTIAAGGTTLSANAATDVHTADQHQEQQQAASSFTAAQLVALLQAFARLRHYDAALLETGCTQLLRSSTRSLNLMAGLVHTCALLNHFNLHLFETAVDIARVEMQQQQQQQQQEEEHQQPGQQQQQQQCSKLLSQQLAQLSWACGVMGHWESGFVQQLCVWSADVDAKSLPAEELLQWHEVQASLTDAALLAPKASPTGVSSSLVVAAQAAWARRQQHRRLTAFQKEVVEALQQAGVRCRINVVLDGPVAVDVALVQPKVGARYRVALQLHPHEDFAANPPHGALGPTAARWRALQARGWRVVTLQQSEWRRLKTKQQQVEYAWQLSQGVQISAPGMPHLVHQVIVDKPKGNARKKKSLPQVLLRILLEGH